MRRISETAVRSLAAVFFSTTLLLSFALAGSWWYTSRLLKAAIPPAPDPLPVLLPSPQLSPLQVQYQLELPGRGEIFPALAASNPADYWPVAVITMVNTSDRPVLQTVSAEIANWSRHFTNTVIIGPHMTVSVRINPELLPAAYQNGEIRRALLEVHASGPGTQPSFTEARAVYLHSISDLYWGNKFENAQFIARWVTPHDSPVNRLIASARKYVPHGRLAGYNGNSVERVAEQARSNARAVFEAMRNNGISYVDSMFTFGNFTSEAQRIRLPRETLTLDSANCIDVSVAFASAMENLGMNPVVVIVPGHAFTGVRLGPDSRATLYLDLTVLPDGTFQQAITRAERWLKKTPTDKVLVVDIAAARALGIYPIPEPGMERS